MDPERSDPDTHPISIFLQAYQGSRDKLYKEKIEQDLIANHGNASTGRRATARQSVTELTSAIGKLDETRTLFLVRVFTGLIAPNQELVDKTVALNKALADAVVANNLPGTYLQIVSDYLDAIDGVMSKAVAASARAVPVVKIKKQATVSK